MPDTPKLFMVYIGGHTPTSNVEVHDIRFIIGQTIEDGIPDLQSEWWGDPDTLHLDCWGAVEQVDGYDVTLSPQPADTAQPKLFFVNLGGYNPDLFDELHKNMLVVAQNEPLAKQQAKAGVTHWKVPHKDTLFEVEKSLDLNALLQKHGLHIHLKKSQALKPFQFECAYTPISAKALAKK